MSAGIRWRIHPGRPGGTALGDAAECGEVRHDIRQTPGAGFGAPDGIGEADWR